MTATPALRSHHYGADHCDISVPNIYKACETYERLGFALAPPSLYDGMPLASAQIILPGFYIALTGFTEPPDGALSKIPPPFRLRAKRHGISYISLGTKDATACAAAFRRAERIVADPFEGRRTVEHDGVKKEVAFKIAMAPLPLVKDTPVDFITEHLTPELIWRDNRPPHPNAAGRVTRIIAVHPDPASLSSDFAEVVGDVSAVGASSIDVDAGAMRIFVTTPAGFAEALPGIPLQSFDPDAPSCHFAAIELLSTDMAQTEALLRGAGTALIKTPHGVAIAAPGAENVALSFVGA